VVLVHGYLKIDPELVLPTMRATVETQLNAIALGKADFHAVLAHTITAFEAKFKYFEAKIESMDELFEVSFSPLSATGKPMSKCAKCLRYMKYIQQRPARLYCQTCDETYSLPDNGKIMLYKELKCPLDGFELLLWSSGTRGQSYPLCPYCYNNPPFAGSKKGEGCNQCPHPTCQHSIVAHGVCPCLECEVGVLVIDPNSAPNWKIACNRCNVVIKAFQNAHKVKATKDVCECGSKILHVDLNKKDAEVDGSTQKEGCMFCDPSLSSLVELHHAQMRHPMHKRGRGGRGRGGGRRGKSGPKGKYEELDQYFV
jgi:DNA topoisomerase-3